MKVAQRPCGARGRTPPSMGSSPDPPMQTDPNTRGTQGFPAGPALADPRKGGRGLRILLLAHKVPYPLLDGYSLHTFNHARELGRRHQLHLLCSDKAPMPAEVSALFRSTRVVAPGPARPRTGLRRWTRALSIHEIFHLEPGVLAGIEESLARGVDLVWVCGIKMLPYAPYVRGVPVLGDIADDERGPALDNLRAARRPLEILRRLRDYSNIVRFQRARLRDVQTCTVVSENDRDAIREQCPWLDVRVVPNGVDSDYYVPMLEDEEPASMVFEGNMHFLPNVDAMRHMVRRVLPLIVREEPRAKLYIVGRDPLPEVRAFAGPNVVVTGQVLDVRPYLARAALFVSPMVSGTGIKNKILQAWSMGRPVLATSRSCGGLEVREGVNMCVADDAGTFARKALELLRDPGRRAAMGLAARETVLRHSTWAHRGRQMDAVLEETARKARGMPTA